MLKDILSGYDPEIADVAITYGPERKGDIPHSLASIEKAKQLLGYNPQFSMQEGLKRAVKWYYTVNGLITNYNSNNSTNWRELDE